MPTVPANIWANAASLCPSFKPAEIQGYGSYGPVVRYAFDRVFCIRPLNVFGNHPATGAG